MKKDVMPIVVVGALALLGIFLIHGNITQTSVMKKASQITVEKNVTVDSSELLHYSIDADYPQISGLSNTNAQTSINNTLNGFVTKNIDSFKSAVASSSKNKNLPKQLRDQTSELTITYTVGQVNNTLTSVAFEVMDSQVGMAHPANSNQTVTFDSKTGKILTLGDLFQPNSNYLQTISGVAHRDLMQKFAGQNGANFLVAQGTAPTTQNYSNFLVTPTTLEIIFNPATVAADFAGTQRVSIPLSQLSSIWNPQYK